MHRFWITALLLGLTSSSCTVDSLGSLGRPCTDQDPCGPGTVCDPVIRTCVKPGAADSTVYPDASVLPDGPGPVEDSSAAEGLPDALAPDTDTGLPDVKPVPDKGPPCAGLTCSLGCNVALNRCYRLNPSNFSPGTLFDQVTHKLVVSSQLVIDTTTGSITDGTTVVRPAGGKLAIKNGILWTAFSQGTSYPDLAVFVLASFKVPAGTTVQVKGSFPLMIYVTEDVEIAGTVVAKASGSVPGSGGSAGGTADGVDAANCQGGSGDGGATNGTNESGGGGGGRGADGGQGGSGASVVGGLGGTPNGSPGLSPLYGGCGGGAGGGDATSDGGHGGGGGGGIQISANNSISVTPTGLVNVSGAGGRGSPDGGGGGGGGAGGAILLEAPLITINGMLAANGGGGGAGGINGLDGQDGNASTAAAQGGAASSYGGAGGAGGAGGSGKGLAGQGTAYNGGGGGGAVGLIRINSPQLTVAPGSSSPAASTTTTVGAW